MKAVSVIGIILIVLGVVALIHGGITYTENKETLDLGVAELDVKEKETIPVSPLLGGIALVAGIALVVTGARK